MTSRRDIERRIDALEDEHAADDEDDPKSIQAAMWKALTDYSDR